MTNIKLPKEDGKQVKKATTCFTVHHPSEKLANSVTLAPRIIRQCC